METWNHNRVVVGLGCAATSPESKSPAVIVGALKCVCELWKGSWKMSLFLKRQLYCCVMKSRCQKVFQRHEKSLGKTAWKLRSLALPELLWRPAQTSKSWVPRSSGTSVLSHPFPARAGNLLPGDPRVARPPPRALPPRGKGGRRAAGALRLRQRRRLTPLRSQLRVSECSNRKTEFKVSCTILWGGRTAASCLSGVWPKCW